MEHLFTISELAKLLEITPRTIRFYEQKGLISPQRAGNTRIYTRRDKARLQLILRGKRLGFSLAEIRDYLDLYEIDRTQTSQLQFLHDKVSERIGDLESQQRDLQQTLSELYEVRRRVDQAMAERAGRQAPDSDAA